MNKWLTWIGANSPYNVEFCSTLMDKQKPNGPLPLDVLYYLHTEDATLRRQDIHMKMYLLVRYPHIYMLQNIHVPTKLESLAAFRTISD